MGISKLCVIPCESNDFPPHRRWSVEIQESSGAVDDVEERGAHLNHSKQLEFWAVHQNLIFKLIFVVFPGFRLSCKFLFSGGCGVTCKDSLEGGENCTIVLLVLPPSGCNW